MRITDRTKDVIKSGGEWVSSIDGENAAISCPGVRVAAVIGVYHPKGEERPLLIVATHPGERGTTVIMLPHLEDKIVKRSMPDERILDEVPLTATGKIDKKVLRDRYYNCLADSRLQAQL